MDLSIFLSEDHYVDFSAPIIQEKSAVLFDETMPDTEKAKTAFEYVRDEIPHSFDVNTNNITARASDVLKYKTGICHAKSNLLAALLRAQGIHTGFCFQRLTLADDDSIGYCLHCYNAIFLQGHWIKVDARGNKKGINAQFSLGEPILAFPIRAEYEEYTWAGIFANPNISTMNMLDNAKSIQDIIDNIPSEITDEPDILE